MFICAKSWAKIYTIGMAAAFMQMFDKYYNGLFFSCVCCKALFIWAQKKAADLPPRVPSGTRTLDPLIKSQLLYQLS